MDWIGTAFAAGIVGSSAAVAGAAGLGVIGAATAAALATATVAAAVARRRAVDLARRDRALAHTAHELRTPLTSVLTALEMVRAGYATTPEETAEFLDEAELAARHLVFLVSDVLDGASLAARHLQLDVADHRVEDLIADARRVLGAQAQRRGVPFACGPLPAGLAVRADRRRCLQVLLNLVGNAIKFSAPGQPVRLELEAFGARVRFAVLDEGPGVPASLRPRLFTPFGRDAGSGADGTGLGLHITQQLVERMGGVIGYAPRVPRGSEFWFELPRAPAHEPAIAPAG